MQATGTIFCDIDGTLFHLSDKPHDKINQLYDSLPPMLGDASDKLLEWHRQGLYIVLTTARPESLRKITEEQLHNNKIVYNQLIMNLPQGPRYLINDNDPRQPEKNKAYAFSIVRNKGIDDIEI